MCVYVSKQTLTGASAVWENHVQTVRTIHSLFWSHTYAVFVLKQHFA